MKRAVEHPVRVVHVIGGLDLGGAETLLYRLATSAVPGVEQEVICLGSPGWYSARLEERGVAVHHLGMRSLASTLAGVSALRRLLADLRPDVVQSWMYFANVLSALVARRAGTPVVWSIHNSSFDRVGLASRLCAYAGGAGARRMTKFVINCSRHSSAMHDRLGYSAVPTAVIPNGYDSAAFRPEPKARATTRAALGMGNDCFVVGSIARWHPHKDIPNLLQALRIAADRGVPLRCLLVGFGLGADSPELTAAMREARCEQLVVPLGLRSDVPDLARALDLHVLPSRSEAFPNVVAETMLSGTPNAVTDVGDAAFMVADTGWVVPPGEPAQLAAAVEQAWRERTDEPAKWDKRRKLARKRIVDNFTFEKMAEAYAKVWRSVAEPS